MAKYPRSKRKMFQIQKVYDTTYDVNHWIVYVYDNKRHIGGFFTKKEARQYIANKRRAMRSREW